MKKLDVRKNAICPYCNTNIGYLWLNHENILAERGPYEKYDFTFGFERYYIYTFECPCCGQKFEVEHSKIGENYPF